MTTTTLPAQARYSFGGDEHLFVEIKSGRVAPLTKTTMPPLSPAFAAGPVSPPTKIADRPPETTTQKGRKKRR